MASAAILFAACADGAAGPPPSFAEVEDERPGIEDLLELAALGYTDFVEGGEPPTGSGVVWHDAVRSSPGYTLIVSLPLACADLVSHDGQVVRSWSDPESLRWSRAELGPDGRLAVIGKIQDQDGDVEGFLAVYSFEGGELWRRRMPVHHDVEWTAGGGLLALTATSRLVGGERVIDNKIARVSGRGELLEESSIFDLLSSAPDLFEIDYAMRFVKGFQGDILHANSVEEVRRPHPLFGVGHVIVSLRRMNSVAVFDLGAERLVWAFARGELLHQHEATVLENGNVLVFDNGGDRRPWSRILEIDPVAREIAWEYRADPPEAFYSEARGTSQGLPGGNVLVANSNSGEVFEITRDGRVVWRYLSRISDGKRVAVRAFRYPAELVVRLLGE